MTDAAIQSLREAVRLSPDNVPLRKALAEALLSLARYAEAEQEYRAALQLAPADSMLKVGLARAFLQQGKATESLVVVEDLLKQRNAPAAAYVLHARLLLRAGEVERAVRQYREALTLDPTAADPELSDRLGVHAHTDAADNEGEIVEGRVRAAWEDPSAQAATPIERPKLKFSDVGGMEAVKDEIRMKILLPLTHPELFKA